MDNEQFDSALDAAAKELLVDAPEELLKGVMYRIEKDAKPKRFAFGRFTGFAAVAAVILIFVSIRSASEQTPNDMAMSNSATAGGGTVMGKTAEPAAVPEAFMFDNNVDAAGGEAELFTGRSMLDEDDGSAFGVPPELSPLEQAMYDWINKGSMENLISVTIISKTDNEIVALVEYVTETIELTVTQQEGSFEFSYDEAPNPQTVELTP